MAMPKDFPTEIQLLYVTPEWGETEIIYLFEGEKYTHTELMAEIAINPRAAEAMAKRVQWFVDNPEPLTASVSDGVAVGDTATGVVITTRQRPGPKPLPRLELIEMCEKYEHLNAKNGIRQQNFARFYTDYSYAQFKRHLREFRRLRDAGEI